MDIIYVQAVLMDNGEIISLGKTLGFEKDMKVFKVISSEEDKDSEKVSILRLK